MTTPTTTEQHGASPTDFFDDLDVESFRVTNKRAGSVRSYERDSDLAIQVKQATGRSGTQDALLLIQLRIDEADYDHVTCDFYNGPWGGEGAAGVLTHAIETLEVLRDQLEVLRPTPDARAKERNAVQIGRDYQRGQRD